MTKRKGKEPDQLFHVGLGDYEDAGRGEDVLAPDAVGAVRQFCEGLPGDYWRDSHLARVWTKDRHWQVRQWDVDASQPPAWIVTRAAD